VVGVGVGCDGDVVVGLPIVAGVVLCWGWLRPQPATAIAASKRMVAIDRMGRMVLISLDSGRC
jgi:hypothetical protein